VIRSVAEETIDHGVHSARRRIRSVRRGIEKLEDLRDEGVHYVKRHPLESVAISLTAGLVVGITTGWVITRSS